MLNRYREYVQVNPLQGWMLTVLGVLVFARVLTWIWPDSGKHGPPLFLFLACNAVVTPTIHLMMRLSADGRRERPISPQQEQYISILSLVASLCGIALLPVGILGRWMGWPLDTRVAWLTGSLIAAAVGAALGYGLRQTRAGRWGLWLSAAWVLVLVGYVAVRLLWRAATHG